MKKTTSVTYFVSIPADPSVPIDPFAAENGAQYIAANPPIMERRIPGFRHRCVDVDAERVIDVDYREVGARPDGKVTAVKV